MGPSYDFDDQSWRANPMAPNLQANLHEVRLTFRWPLAKGTKRPGPPGLSDRSSAAPLQGTNEPWFLNPNPSQPSGYDLYFFQPGTYVKAP